MRCATMRAAATVAGVMVLRPATPVAAVLVWLGAQVFVSPYILAMNARVLKLTQALGIALDRRR